MKTYTCFRTQEDALCRVASDGGEYWLEPRLDLRNHSPAGFGWGYAGSGPAQLALAMLADYFAGDAPPSSLSDAFASSLYQTFKFRAITPQPAPGFALTSPEIRGLVRELVAPDSGAFAPFLSDLVAADLCRLTEECGERDMPSFEVYRCRLVASMLAGFGCSPGTAERLCHEADVRGVYNAAVSIY